METKFSVMRAFGSEQFSTTVSFDKVATTVEADEALKVLGHSLEGAFDAVLKREDEEKKKLIAASKSREEANKKLTEQLTNETQTVKSSEKTLKQAEKFVVKGK
jgi:hypothetical protein